MRLLLLSEVSIQPRNEDFPEIGERSGTGSFNIGSKTRRAQTWDGLMQEALERIFGLQGQSHTTHGLVSTAGREAALRSLLKNENTREFALAQPIIREFASFNKLDLG